MMHCWDQNASVDWALVQSSVFTKERRDEKHIVIVNEVLKKGKGIKGVTVSVKLQASKNIRINTCQSFLLYSAINRHRSDLVFQYS